MTQRSIAFLALLLVVMVMSSCNRNVCPTFSHPASAVEAEMQEEHPESCRTTVEGVRENL